MYTPKKEDPVGRLIAQLHTIRDDIEFQKKMGMSPSMDEYPEAKQGLITLVVPRPGVFTPHIDRIERAGVYVVSTGNTIHLYFSDTRGALSFSRPTSTWGKVTPSASTPHYFRMEYAR